MRNIQYEGFYRQLTRSDESLNIFHRILQLLPFLSQADFPQYGQPFKTLWAEMNCSEAIYGNEEHIQVKINLYSFSFL